MKKCEHCLTEFEPSRNSSGHQIYCSDSCNQKACRLRHLALDKARKKAYREKNKAKIAADHKTWRANNKDKVKAYLAIPSNKIAANLRSRLSKAIGRKQKTVSMNEYLGCSLEELKRHLESQFKAGMTWDNYGEWHIDHIKPLILFDLSDPEQVKQACNYKNLQPLWAKDNISKGDSFNEVKDVFN